MKARGLEPAHGRYRRWFLEAEIPFIDAQTSVDFDGLHGNLATRAWTQPWAVWICERLNGVPAPLRRRCLKRAKDDEEYYLAIRAAVSLNGAAGAVAIIVGDSG